jgi:hypothetical protein
MSSTWIGSGLTRKHYTRLERLAWEKHSSLLDPYVSYGEKSFVTTNPVAQIQNFFFVTNAQGKISWSA